MDFAEELETIWRRDSVQQSYVQWRSERERFRSRFQPPTTSFLSGNTSSSDLLDRSAEWDGQGFSGNGLMFFRQLVKWVSPRELDQALRVILDPPGRVGGAEPKLRALHELIYGVLASGRGVESRRMWVGGESVPVGMPDLKTRRAAFFASFFWGIAQSDGWPIMWPAWRDFLIEREMLEGDLTHPDLYMNYCDRITQVKSVLGISSWAVEFVLGEVRLSTK